MCLVLLLPISSPVLLPGSGPPTRGSATSARVGRGGCGARQSQRLLVEVGLLLEPTTSLLVMAVAASAMAVMIRCSSRRGLFVISVLVGESAVFDPLLLLLCLLLLLRLHSIMIHAGLTTDGVSIPTLMTISHVVRRGTIPTQIGVVLVIIPVSAARGVIVLVLVAIGAVSSPSASLLVSTASALVVIPASSSATGSAAAASLVFIVTLMRLMRGGAIPSSAHALSGHQPLLSIPKLMTSLLGGCEGLLSITRVAILHAVRGMAHLGELASVHVRRVGILHGGHSGGDAGGSGVVARGSSSSGIVAWDSSRSGGGGGCGGGGLLHPVRSLLLVLLLLMLTALVKLGSRVVLLSIGLLLLLLVSGAAQWELARWHAAKTVGPTMDVVHAHSTILRHARWVDHLTSQLIHNIKLRLRRRLSGSSGSSCFLGDNSGIGIHHLGTKRGVFELVLELVNKHRIRWHGGHGKTGGRARRGGSVSSRGMSSRCRR
mmetsp:Transcript_8564/g.13951  ORF Transcript_8564/g.13951 Transcript_8564/m.13951 type:complete len:488 (-) Transcript_8564:1151-2614(-)